MLSPDSRTGRLIRTALHAAIVVSAFTLIFRWLWGENFKPGSILAESDLFEYYLPIFLAPITNWSHFEFSGLPAFADPGDFTLYPLHYFFARIVHSWAGMVVSAYVLGASFMYAYVYRQTRSKAAAAFAGLAYGLSETMVERVAQLGFLHALAWIPLLFLALDGVAGGAGWRWVAVGGIAVAGSFLAGHPQIAVYTVYCGLAYAGIAGWREGLGRRYYLRAFSVFFVGGLLASVKAMPLAEASLYMARQEVNFGQFVNMAHTPWQMLGVLIPMIQHNGRETPLYVGLGTLLFAAIGARQWRTNWRSAFWVVVAVLALLMGMGASTPLATIAFYVPLYDGFRVSARHLVFFAVAASTLAGIGLDAIRRRQATRGSVIGAGGGLLLAVVAAAFIIYAFPTHFELERRQPLPWTLPLWDSGIWVQIAIAAVTALAALLLAWTRRFAIVMTLFCVILFGDLLYSVQYFVTLNGVQAGYMSSAILTPSVHATRLAAQVAPTHQRLFALSGTHRDAVVPAAWARVWQIPIAGAYGPMLLNRYSLMATMGTNGSVSVITLSPLDRALDLLAVKELIVQPDDYPEPPTIEAEGVTWAESPLGLSVGRDDCGLGVTATLSLPLPEDVDVSQVAAMMALRCADAMPQGAELGSIEVVDAGGIVHGRQVWHAGVDISDQALAEPSIRERSEQRWVEPAVDPSGGPAYLTRLSLDAPVRNGRVVFHGAATNGWLVVQRLTATDTAGKAWPQTLPSLFLADRQHWQPIDRFSTSRVTDRGRDEEDSGEVPYVVYENRRVQPRAWMVSELVPIEDAEAVKAIRFGQFRDGRLFDVSRMAMIDPVDGAARRFSEGATADVTDIHDGHVSVNVSAPAGGFLVLSEGWYPGWRARIDGTIHPVVRTNLALQGVVVPAGAHTVEFELVSMTQRIGAGLSLLGVALTLVLLVWRR